jgi:hypothetical protein
MQPGDVALLKFRGATSEGHVALIVDHPTRGFGLLHALNGSDGKGRVIEHGMDDAWRAKIVSVFRPKVY